MRVVGEAGGQIGHEGLQRIGRRRPVRAGLPPFHVGLERSPVAVDVTADRGERPAPGRRFPVGWNRWFDGDSPITSTDDVWHDVPSPALLA